MGFGSLFSYYLFFFKYWLFIGL